MVITKNIVVLLEYKLIDEKENIIDSSEVNGSLSFIQGVGMMMPGIEKVIEGKEVGFEYKGIIDPEDAYGEYNPKNVFPAPRSHFEHLVDQMEEGKTYQFDTGGGNYQMLKVVKIDDNVITLDANHPYAGEKITFECKIINAREATEDEMNGTKRGCGCSSGNKSGGCCSSGKKEKTSCCKSKSESGKSGCGCSH